MEIIVMPKLGFNMDAGKLVQWYKNEGDPVRKGEPLFSVETDKTNIDVEATQDGIVRKLFIPEGKTVPVTLPIAVVADADEDITRALDEALSALGAHGGPSAAAPAASAPPAAPQASASKRDYDVIVIGGGPGGYVAAIRAAQHGLKTAVAEQERLGGVCLNRGCIPTKILLRSLAALREIKDAERFGITGVKAENAVLDMRRVQARKREIRDTLVAGVNALLQKNKVDILTGEARVPDRNTVTVANETYTTDNIIIATGSENKSLPGGVIARKDLLTSDTALELERIPDEIVVIGGGVIGVEFAYFFAGAGSKVTVVEYAERILPPVDAEIAALVRGDLEAMGIVIHTGARVTRITRENVEFEKGSEGGKETIPARNVLMAVGRAPRITIDAEKLGIRTEKGAILTDARMRTSVPGIYAVGDVNGKHMLAHTASAEGIAAADNIAGKDAVMRYGAIPSAVYIEPEIASTGLTEEEARSAYGRVRVGKFPMRANGKSMVEGDTRGLIKVIADEKYGEILGVHLYCRHAADMIAEVTAAVTAEATAEEIAASVHPHPTLSEAVQEAFHAVLGKAVHI
ncbi:MAG: dihydrolipoyl dehydrogenase [Clostridiales Family XIII bacterium]|jgi:dihydrolipoamide dehydrogenase|nr:dihydrolipoyl dehydrogenase [Clostridiales Family XIII bacterium]